MLWDIKKELAVYVKYSAVVDDKLGVSIFSLSSVFIVVLAFVAVYECINVTTDSAQGNQIA